MNENTDLLYYTALVTTATLILLVVVAVKLSGLESQAESLLSTAVNAEQNFIDKLKI